MSIAQTWLDRVIGSFLSRSGEILCRHGGAMLRMDAPARRCSACDTVPRHPCASSTARQCIAKQCHERGRGDVQPTNLKAFLHQQTLEHPAPREGEPHVQLVDPVHQLQVGI